MLKSQWMVGADNVVLRGALMHFQSVNGLPTTGNMDTPTWQTLLSAALKHQYDPAPYGYVVVTQSLPQHLDLYVNGKHTYTSLVNTGISVAPTSNGTYPVYLRYLSTTMSGTNPNGTKYHDTGIPWTSYFHGGDALHGFIRNSYGSPQSLGCVEMPFTNAGKVFPYTPIGTLVTVK
jgi:lipoprotein-anchoring transpeptidase ErfK/SrfK